MTKKKEKGTELVQSNKRIAADGTQRGLQRYGNKNRRTELFEACQAAVKKLTGIPDWDPVVMLAVISARAFVGYPAVDEDGRAIIDEVTGEPVMVPPDHLLASAVAAKAAPYLHGAVRSREVGKDDDQPDPEEVRDSVLTALENMGVKVNR